MFILEKVQNYCLHDIEGCHVEEKGHWCKFDLEKE
jgi:hypothetical protein